MIGVDDKGEPNGDIIVFGLANCDILGNWITWTCPEKFNSLLDITRDANRKHAYLPILLYFNTMYIHIYYCYCFY
jgi:hypothetical protein